VNSAQGRTLVVLGNLLWILLALEGAKKLRSASHR